MRLLKLLNLIPPFEFDEILGRLECAMPFSLPNCRILGRAEAAVIGLAQCTIPEFGGLVIPWSLPDCRVLADRDTSVSGRMDAAQSGLTEARANGREDATVDSNNIAAVDGRMEATE